MFKRIAAVAACLMFCGACAQHAGVPDAGSLPNLADLSDSKAASSTITLTGADTEQRSAGSQVIGQALHLPATAGAVEWGLFRFGIGEVQPETVSCGFDEGNTDEAWIAVGNFDELRWDFFGPFSPDAEVAFISGVDYISPNDNLFVAVLATGANAVLDEIQLVFDANQPPTAIFTANPQTGAPGAPVDLDASGSSDPDGSIVSYEWDLDGNGSFETVSGPVESTTLPDPAGSVDVTLRVTDNEGAEGEHTVTLSSGAAPSWHFYPVHTSAATHGTAQLIELGGTPAVCFVEAAAGLQFAYTTSADGSGTWDTAMIDDTIVSTSNMTSSLADINGTPAVAYHNNDNDDLRFAYTAQADGSGGWTVNVLDPLLGHGYSPSLAQVNGKPAVAYSTDAPLLSEITYGYSASSDGSGSWSFVSVDITGSPRGPSLAVVNGKPAIAYADDTLTTSVLGYAYSSELDGSSGWTTLAAYSDRAPADGSLSLALVDGFPAVSFRSFLSGDGNDIQYAHSSFADGSGGWSAVTIQDGGVSTTLTDLAVLGGFPAACYHTSGSELVLATSSSSDGSSGWMTETVNADGTKGSLAEINGSPAIAFQNASGIQFAIYN